jgi:hypothetical protein
MIAPVNSTFRRDAFLQNNYETLQFAHFHQVCFAADLNDMSQSACKALQPSNGG